jgi:methylthioribose-1-phosphate isomerase
MRLPHPAPLSGARYSAVELLPDLDVVVMDQRRLPGDEVYEILTCVDDIARAIRDMLVRGAPAIGITAAYGLVVAARASTGDFLDDLGRSAATLRATRPTAVNLAWALDRMMVEARSVADQPAAARADRLAAAARALHQDDVAACRAIGAHGAALVPDGATILTHCNAGALATGGFGTALGIVRAAAATKTIRVLACETRPYWQGARLTAWELREDGIPVEVITDSMAGHFMRAGAVQLVVVGADRVARSGDVANKIGTYTHACLARAHDIPFLVAAPFSTVDLATLTGGDIVIEERAPRELSHVHTPAGDLALVPEGVGVRNPAFDVTPAGLITAIVTERGLVRPVDASSLAALAPATFAPGTRA